MVALKSRCCRPAGSSDSSDSIWGKKPMSIIRSASSMAATERLHQSKIPFSPSSRTRPGVATRSSAPSEMALVCGPMGDFPTATATVNRRRLVSSSASWATWNASSRVGTSTRPRNLAAPFAKGFLGFRPWRRPLGICASSTMRWIMGTKYANVFPRPVCAMPMTSFPSSAGGIAAA